MKVALHTNQLSLRGTEVSMYDYAKYNEDLLGNQSIIVTKDPKIQKFTDPLAVEKFCSRFPVHFYRTVDELQSILDSEKVDVFYAQKAGMVDDIVSKNCKTVVHAVFQYEQPHGNVYAYISEWLSNLYGNRHPFVPYMVDLPNENGDLRKELGIPKDAVVYGRHGGYETFDHMFVKHTVLKIAETNPNIYFIFMNTEKWFTKPLENIIFIEPTSDLIRKTQFINTCDAMLHARINGESFGLAVAEFSIRNKPVLTHRFARDTAHIAMLGDKGRYYSDAKSLELLLLQKWDNTKDWNAYSAYSPENVMQKFKSVFL